MHRHNITYKHGDKVTAQWMNYVNSELHRLGNITGNGGIDVRQTLGGITIGADIQNSADVRWAIARIEGDTGPTGWPTLQEWSEADPLLDGTYQQVIFDFEFVEPAWGTSIDDPVPASVFPWTQTGEFVRALNVTEHYVPHWMSYGGYVTQLVKRNGVWHAHYELPPIIQVVCQEDLFPNQYCDAAVTDNELGNAGLRIYDNGWLLPEQHFLAGGTALCKLHRLYGPYTRPIWRYFIFDVRGCPVMNDGEEE